jgi:hypothetical protein
LDVGSTESADGGGDDETLVGRAASLLRPERSESFPRRIAWADLLKRVFEVDALRCPACGGRMRLLAAITDSSVARRVFECLALTPRAPPVALAHEIDPEAAVDDRASEPALADEQSDSGFEFDRALSADRAPDDVF